MKKTSFSMVMILGLGMLCAAQYFTQTGTSEPPQAKIANAKIQATIYLPDAANGFYRGARFDWSSAASLKFEGKTCFGQWFAKVDPKVADIKYDPALKGYVAGPNSAITGPAEEFSAVGYKEAAAGGSFLKVGVGMLSKPKEANYDPLKSYMIVNSGKWTVKAEASRVELVQQLVDKSGYGYVYTKTISLHQRQPEMRVEHSLKNTGKKVIETNMTSYNFYTLEGAPLSLNYELKMPTFKWKAPAVAPTKEKDGYLISDEIEIHFEKDLQGDEKISIPVEGFSNDAKDSMILFKVRVTNGLAPEIVSDQPLAKMEVVAMRPFLSPRPSFAVKVEPGSEFKWSTTYGFSLVVPPDPGSPNAAPKGQPRAPKAAPAAEAPK
jgi:hypothetical protein